MRGPAADRDQHLVGRELAAVLQRRHHRAVAARPADRGHRDAGHDARCPRPRTRPRAPRRRTAPRERSSRSAPSRTVTSSQPRRLNAWAISTPTRRRRARAAARDLLRAGRRRGCPTGRLGQARDRRDDAAPCRWPARPPGARCSRRGRRRRSTSTARSPASRPRPRTSVMPLLLEPRQLARRRASRGSCSRAGRTRPRRPGRRSPPAAAPGTRRAAAITSPGRTAS